MNISTHFSPAQPMTLSSRPSTKPATAESETTTTEARSDDDKTQAAGSSESIGKHVDTKA